MPGNAPHFLIEQGIDARTVRVSWGADSDAIHSFDSVAGLSARVAEAVPAPDHRSCLLGCLAGEHRSYVAALAHAGIDQIIALDDSGVAAGPMVHAGFALRALVRVVREERTYGLQQLLREVAEAVPFYRDRQPPGAIDDLSAWPLLTSVDLAREPLPFSRRLLNETTTSGSIFSSGGTATAPKYALYAPAEFSRSAALLASGFLASGLCPGERVLNLFVAGHLWSSFLVVDEALRHCGVYVLPMGGLAAPEEILSCLSRFRPQVVFGLPSMLVDFARHGQQAGAEISVERVFYAGEHLNVSAREYLQSVWGVRQFHSAGYAAVDVGPIGWQCRYCGAGEHHLFSRDIHLEIVDEEAVVTSLLRRSMPVVRYRTGDRVVWLNGRCACGSVDPRFRLLGRVDGIMNIWGCRLALEDVERSLLVAGMSASVRQVVLSVRRSADGAQDEILTIRLEQSPVQPVLIDRFIDALLHHANDLAVAVAPGVLRSRLCVKCEPPGSIPRMARTGKVRLIVDERFVGGV